MTAFKVVSVNILPNRQSRFLDVIVLSKISFLIFEASKPAFNHDIIGPTALAVHALTDFVILNKIYILLAGKLAALIRIQNLWFGYFKSFVRAFITIVVSSVSSTSQPTIQRLYQSMTAVR